MIEITVLNCDGKEVQYSWTLKETLVKDINSDNEIIPMLDDVLLAVDTDDDELATWWRESDEFTVNDLYKKCLTY